MNLVKVIFIFLISCMLFGCTSVTQTELPGSYTNIKPNYPELARYVLTDRMKGARVAGDKLILGEDMRFLKLNRANDTTVTGNWRLLSGKKIETSVIWHDSIHKNTYTRKGNKLFTITTVYSCQDSLRTKPEKMLAVYQKTEK